MKYAIYNNTTGEIRSHLICSPDNLARNTPPDHTAIVGAFDPPSQRIDLAVHAQIEALRSEQAEHDANIANSTRDLVPNTISMDGGISADFRRQTEGDIRHLEQAKAELQASIDALLPSLVVDYQPPQPSSDHMWNSITKRWELTADAQSRVASAASTRAAIKDLEQQQIRRAIDVLAKTDPQLNAIADQITELRKAL